MLPSLAYLYGKPQSSGDLRSSMSDFKVFECLPFQPSGEGEHLLIHVKKTGVNTVFVAKQLAKYFKIKEMLVSYAGLKDRFAVTEQWFGVHLPGKENYDLSDLTIEGIELITYARHHKKLRTGALIGNRFELILRNVTNLEALETRWQKIVESGVPNYFGEQRFGINGGNIDRAKALFNGSKVRDKKKRGLYLSAARSLIFNQVVSARIVADYFNTVSQGDVCMLGGTQSVFVVETPDDKIKQRLQEQDIDLTAPLWGAGELMTQAQPKTFEQQVADKQNEICTGLAKFGLKQERRRMRLSLTNGQLSTEGNEVKLSFFLPSGCYATTILRELIDYQDLTERAHASNNNRKNENN